MTHAAPRYDTHAAAVGRDIDDPQKPLGASLLQQTADEARLQQDAAGDAFASHATDAEAIETAAADALERLANRTKVVAILRKAEEFLATRNPPPDVPGGIRRALELAAGRMGLEIAEYETIVERDPALADLAQAVVDRVLRSTTASP